MAETQQFKNEHLHQEGPAVIRPLGSVYFKHAVINTTDRFIYKKSSVFKEMESAHSHFDNEEFIMYLTEINNLLKGHDSCTTPSPLFGLININFDNVKRNRLKKHEIDYIKQWFEKSEQKTPHQDITNSSYDNFFKTYIDNNRISIDYGIAMTKKNHTIMDVYKQFNTPEYNRLFNNQVIKLLYHTINGYNCKEDLQHANMFNVESAYKNGMLLLDLKHINVMVDDPTIHRIMNEPLRENIQNIDVRGDFVIPVGIFLNNPLLFFDKNKILKDNRQILHASPGKEPVLFCENFPPVVILDILFIISVMLLFGQSAFLSMAHMKNGKSDLIAQPTRDDIATLINKTHQGIPYHYFIFNVLNNDYSNIPGLTTDYIFRLMTDHYVLYKISSLDKSDSLTRLYSYITMFTNVGAPGAPINSLITKLNDYNLKIRHQNPDDNLTSFETMELFEIQNNQQYLIELSKQLSDEWENLEKNGINTSSYNYRYNNLIEPNAELDEKNMEFIRDKVKIIDHFIGPNINIVTNFAINQSVLMNEEGVEQLFNNPFRSDQFTLYITCTTSDIRRSNNKKSIELAYKNILTSVFENEQLKKSSKPDVGSGAYGRVFELVDHNRRDTPPPSYDDYIQEVDYHTGLSSPDSPVPAFLPMGEQPDNSPSSRDPREGIGEIDGAATPESAAQMTTPPALKRGGRSRPVIGDGQYTKCNHRRKGPVGKTCLSSNGPGCCLDRPFSENCEWIKGVGCRSRQYQYGFQKGVKYVLEYLNH